MKSPGRRLLKNTRLNIIKNLVGKSTNVIIKKMEKVLLAEGVGIALEGHTSVFSRCLCRSPILDILCKQNHTVWGTARLSSKVFALLFIPSSSLGRFRVFLSSPRLLSVFLLISIPVGMKWYLTVDSWQSVHLCLCQVLAVACSMFSCCTQTLRCGMWDLLPWTGIEPGPPAMGAQSLTTGPPGKSSPSGLI